MERFARIAVAVLLLAMAGSASADPSVISTRCQEIEVPLGADYSASRLAGCGEEYLDDLLWHLDRIDQVDGDLDGRFDRANAGGGSVVYVMDTGILARHSEFAGPLGSRVVAGFDVAGTVGIGNSICRSTNKATAPCYSDYLEAPTASHGTSVASIVAGRRVGVAPDAVLVSIRVMNERGLATTRTYLDGLDAVIRHAWSTAAPPFQTAVVNISGWVLERLSSTSSDGVPVIPYAEVERKIRTMIDGVDANGRPSADGKRFLFVVAGNNLDGGCGRAGTVDRFPAILGKDIAGVITVGGMTPNNDWWNGACRGGIEVLAPAQAIFSASITANDHYRGRRPNLRSGTSFATPIIAGIAARMLSDRPYLTPQQLEALIASTPSRISNPRPEYGEGKVVYFRDGRPSPVTLGIATLVGLVDLER